jgi:hypothetical protein
MFNISPGEAVLELALIAFIVGVLLFAIRRRSD